MSKRFFSALLSILFLISLAPNTKANEYEVATPSTEFISQMTETFDSFYENPELYLIYNLNGELINSYILGIKARYNNDKESVSIELANQISTITNSDKQESQKSRSQLRTAVLQHQTILRAGSRPYPIGTVKANVSVKFIWYNKNSYKTSSIDWSTAKTIPYDSSCSVWGAIDQVYLNNSNGVNLYYKVAGWAPQASVPEKMIIASLVLPLSVTE